MKRDNKSGNIPTETRVPGSIVPPDLTASADEAPRGININFHSAEFNYQDDLNDYSGNCRTFQSLEGVITADMLHQIERRREAGDAAAAARSAPKKNASEKNNVSEAEEPAEFPPVTVISQGRILIIDTDVQRARKLGKHLGDQGLTCTLVVTGKAAATAGFPGRGRSPVLEIEVLSIKGAFGNFSAMAMVKGEQRPLTEWLGDEAAAFDLVLDLQPLPSFAGGRLPLGYYAPGPDPVNLNEVMTELPQMRGRFHKPQFTNLLPNRCLHGLSRKTECRRCLAVCPSGAIQSANRKISFNHGLCQDCGGCALVCPAEAIHMLQLSDEDLLNSLRRTLEDGRARSVAQPTIVISDGETAKYTLLRTDEIKQDHKIYFRVEQIGRVGLDILLTCLAYGAGRVVVACDPQNAPSIISAVQWHVLIGQTILRGLGLPEDTILFAFIPRESDQPGRKTFAITCCETRPDMPLLPPAEFSCHNDKQTLVRLAAQHLYDQSGVTQPSLALPAGSPFGAVGIESTSCTLCMACAAACPSGALVAGGDAPKLEFIESRCHQCGLCEEACPEKALRLSPRLLCDRKAVETPVVLHEAKPVRCVECGIPFASQAMINRMQNKLTGHWMYTSERQLRRLQMCRTCRTRDALMSQDLKSWNQVQL